MEPDKTQKKKPAGSPIPPPAGRMLFTWLLLLLLFLPLYQYFATSREKSNLIPYSPDFLTLVASGNINKSVILLDSSGSGFLEGERKDVMDENTGKFGAFRVEAPVTEDLVALLSEHNVPFTFKSRNPLIWNILGGILPILLLFGLFYFFFYRNMNNGARSAFSFGKSRARLMNREQNPITFKDVAGVDEAREEVQEIIEFLRDPKKFQRLGGRIPKGVLLVGPPGTGKTLIAKAIAGEAQVPFFSISGSDFVEMFVGVGASRVRDMFEQGKKSAPCIIFIDEIDAVGRSRFSGIGGGHDEREQTLNALLVEMDGFDAQEGIIIVAATNRPDVLDPALLRPGRFDRQIVVDLPTLDGRVAILQIHARKVKLADDVDLRNIARGTPGFSGADLANLINEAALFAARRDADAITEKDLEEARDKVCWGRERRSHRMDEKDRLLTACHEAGHAIAIALSEGTEPLHKVTIIPRGQALGATFQLPEKDRYTQSRKRLLADLVGSMGGRAAEQISFGEITTGASADIKHATSIARRMVTEWGMSDKLGPQYFGSREELLFLGREVNRSNEISEETAKLIDSEVKHIIDNAYQESLKILTANKDKLDILAQLLMERETLDGYEVMEIIHHGRLLTPAERKAAAPDKPEDPPPPPPPGGPAPILAEEPTQEPDETPPPEPATP